MCGRVFLSLPDSDRHWPPWLVTALFPPQVNNDEYVERILKGGDSKPPSASAKKERDQSSDKRKRVNCNSALPPFVCLILELHSGLFDGRMKRSEVEKTETAERKAMIGREVPTKTGIVNTGRSHMTAGERNLGMGVMQIGIVTEIVGTRTKRGGRWMRPVIWVRAHFEMRQEEG